MTPDFCLTVPGKVAHIRVLIRSYSCVSINVHKEDRVKNFRIIVERYSDGYVGYPLRLKGVIVGQGNTYEETLADVKSAIRFHIETFGKEALF